MVDLSRVYALKQQIIDMRAAIERDKLTLERLTSQLPEKENQLTALQAELQQAEAGGQPAS